MPNRSQERRPGNRAFLLLAAASVIASTSCGSTPTTIHAGLLLDGRGGRFDNALVTVVGHRITAVGPYPGGPVTWDLARYTLLPGLIDAHVHISGYLTAAGRVHFPGDGQTPDQEAAGRAANALVTLRAGFTTIASMGADTDRPLRDAINRGTIPGPRILTSFDPFTDTAVTPRRLRRMVATRKATGADFIKIMNSASLKDGGAPVFSDDQMHALCAEARRQGLRAVVHAQTDAGLEAAVAAGCDEVEHGFLATARGVAAVGRAGTFYDPQCGLIIRNYIENSAAYQGVRGFDSAGIAYMESLRPIFPGTIRTALAVPGLKLLYGTDATPGAHGRNAEDLVCRVREAGEQPMDALISATSRNAEALGLGTRIGTLAPGFEADLIAIEGNPLQEIEAVLRVKFVMKGGKVFLQP